MDVPLRVPAHRDTNSRTSNPSPARNPGPEASECPARHRGFEPLTYGSGGRAFPANQPESVARAGAVTAIRRALEAAAASDPRALAMAITAMEATLDAFEQIEEASALATDAIRRRAAR
jgi:hypothetical protein